MATAVASLTLALPVKAEVFAPNGQVIATPGKNAKAKYLEGRIESDGFLTPGTQETVTLRRMPKRAELFAVVSPSFFSRTCSIRCSSAELRPPVGDAPFGIQTDGNGRAAITFTMPTHYSRTVRTKSGKKRRITVPYKQGDIVFLSAFSLGLTRKRIVFALAFQEDVIFFPSAPPQP